MGFFRESKKKPGGINEALNHKERVEAEKAAKSPEWAAAKRRLEELSGPEGQHLAERQRLQERFESDMRKLREKQAAEKSELLQAVSELDPEAAAQAAIQQERFEQGVQVFGKRLYALSRLLDEFIIANEIDDAVAQSYYWRAFSCQAWCDIITAAEGARYAEIP